MDNIDNPAPTESQEQELSHSDKMIGVITEPAATFQKTAKFPVKTIDWFLPVFLLLVFVALQQIVLKSNADIAYQLKQKQMEAIDKNLSKQVEAGNITQEQANQRRDMIADQMDKMGGGIGMVIQTVSILIIGFIVYFIMTGIYFLFAKFVFKGDGSYTDALVANGLTAYIGIIAVILITIVAFLMGKFMQDLSVGSLLSADKSTLTGWFLYKLDIFSLWAYIVLSIGLSKMFKAESASKYYILVFGVWLIGGLIMHFVGKAVPFLAGFAG